MLADQIDAGGRGLVGLLVIIALVLLIIYLIRRF
jgi:flagellar biogenesis protein FliO